jgi:mannose-6-phosphate isomerase-like protein (cupin superfamily)
MSTESANDIQSTYLHFRNDGRANALPTSAAFWEELANGQYPQLEQGRLMSAFTFAAPWPTWERHPEGEELVMLLAGAVTLVLDDEGNERTLSLNQVGAYVLIPQGVWHTARTSVPTTMLFLTPGAGTEHRAV